MVLSSNNLCIYTEKRSWRLDCPNLPEFYEIMHISIISNVH